MLQYWQETTAFDLGVASELCLLCVGSTEQHSDYLPLGTDSIIGQNIAEMAAKKAACRVTMLPYQEIGFSPHHRAFPGCLTLSQETLVRYLFEICACAYQNHAKRLMILNSHGGNQTCLQAVVNEIGSRLQKQAVLVRYWDLVAKLMPDLRETGPGGMGHAGELETSLMLYFRPDLVKTEKIDDRAPATGSEWHHPDLFATNKVYLYKPFEEFSTQGNVGEPAYASKEKGERFAAVITDELARLMDDYIKHGL